MPDVGGEDWRNFVCVEAANVRPHHVQLPVGAVHATTTRISIIPQR
jgi:D-hexose-6-phosphate mutarotase